MAEMDFSTKCIHGDETDFNGSLRKRENNPVAPPISMSTTFELGDAEVGMNFIYSRESTPTRERLENVVAKLEHQNAKCLAFSSGLSAAHAAFWFFKPKRVAISRGYHGVHGILQEMSGMKLFEVIPLEEDYEYRAGDLLWIETPVNGNNEVRNVQHYVKIRNDINANLDANEGFHSKVHICCDATFAPPPLQNLLGMGVDLVMHSGTKYFGGHSDALIGFLVTLDDYIYHSIRKQRTTFGAVPGSMETWLTLRSVKTLELRVMKQSDNAEQLVMFLHQVITDQKANLLQLSNEETEALKAKVNAVYYPSVQIQSGNSNWIKEQMPGGYGGVFALKLASNELCQLFLKHVNLWTNATSLGGIESLVDFRGRWDPTAESGLMRFSTGIENVVDLARDIVQAFVAA